MSLAIYSHIIDVTMFPDNTSQVWRLPETAYPEGVWVTWKFEHEGEFMHLAQLKDLLDHLKVSPVLDLPYLPYGRQDKEISCYTTFALRTFAKLLNALNFQQVIIQDPHSKVALDLINNSIPCYCNIKTYYNMLNANLVCYPDAGAEFKYAKIYDYPYIVGNKARDQATGHITQYELVGKCEDKNVLIIDDICDGGGTFTLLADELKKAGARNIYLFVTHGIFSKGTKHLFNAGISRIFTQEGELCA